MTAARSRARAHVFVDDVDGPLLADDDRHHLERVLRLRAGDAITVADGRGRWRACSFGPRLTLDGDTMVDPPPSPPVTVAFALTKGDKPELAVQKLTEVGADRIVLVMAEHSVARWDDDKAGRALARLRKVAREAAMQSRRTWLPEVAGPVPFAEAAGIPGASLADVGGDPPSLARPAVLVGPEGGWSDAERSTAGALGLPTVGLATNVLRAETAAVIAGALLAALRSGVVGPACAI
ncbi:MAG: rsmE [Acidimicrobiales bacterium]|nr:rsmE [Acidimicrobiales bacterium]